MSRILKGEIYLADLNPTVGSEIAKTRPVLVVSNASTTNTLLLLQSC